ncbi:MULTISPECIES: hypothetical protein [unclassified Rickettsia]|uniref:hypothetical protein n=1 Tax=unclassified Rickettsia TaxID=114295 RepID=UPI0031329989
MARFYLVIARSIVAWMPQTSLRATERSVAIQKNNKFHSTFCHFFPRLPRRCYASPRNDGVFCNDFDPRNNTALTVLNNFNRSRNIDIGKIYILLTN